MRAALLGLICLLALSGQASAQMRGGFGGHFGGFGHGGFAHPGWFGHGFHPRGGFAGRFRQRFDSANVTHNGRLTLDQARQGHMGMIARHFGEIDAGHKGYITMDDIRAYQQTVRARRRAAQGDPTGPGAPFPP